MSFYSGSASFNPLSFQQAAPQVSGMEAGTQMAQQNAQTAGQLIQNQGARQALPFVTPNLQQALQHSYLQNQQTAIQNQYMPQQLSLANQQTALTNQYIPGLANANIANLGAQANLTNTTAGLLPAQTAANIRQQIYGTAPWPIKLSDLPQSIANLITPQGATSQAAPVQPQSNGQTQNVPRIPARMEQMGASPDQNSPTGYSVPAWLPKGQGIPIGNGNFATSPDGGNTIGVNGQAPQIAPPPAGTRQLPLPPNAGAALNTTSTLLGPSGVLSNNPENMPIQQILHNSLNAAGVNPAMAPGRGGQGGTYETSTGPISTDTNQNTGTDQRIIAGIQRVTPTISKMADNLASTLSYGGRADTWMQQQLNEMDPDLNLPLPLKVGTGEAELKESSESMVKTFGLNGTEFAMNTMMDALKPAKGETPTQYKNFITNQLSLLQMFEDQAKTRLTTGTDLNQGAGQQALSDQEEKIAAQYQLDGDGNLQVPSFNSQQEFKQWMDMLPKNLQNQVALRGGS